MTEPNPLFPFADYEAARNALLRAVEEREPYVLMTGESGCGKTSLVREIGREIDRCRTRLFYFNLARLSPAGLVRVLARSLRMPPLRSQPETVKAIAKILRDEPWHSLLVVDEAQLLPEETFSEIRTLSEVELDGAAVVTVLLAGLPDLRERLRAPHLYPMWRRLLCRIEITGLSRDEVRPFAEHTLGPDPARRIDDQALDLLFEPARGIPGLLRPYLDRMARIDGDSPLDRDDEEDLSEIRAPPERRLRLVDQEGGMALFHHAVERFGGDAAGESGGPDQAGDEVERNRLPAVVSRGDDGQIGGAGQLVEEVGVDAPHHEQGVLGVR